MDIHISYIIPPPPPPPPPPTHTISQRGDPCATAAAQRDVDYIITGGKVRLVSESRGRVAWLQRLPDGLHAAVEAKEGLSATDTGEILDSITIESLIRGYPTLCGMTGTAVAVGEQLREFYGVEVAVIPPNVPCVRTDEPDRLYETAEAKEEAITGRHGPRSTRPRRFCSGPLISQNPNGWRPNSTAKGLPCVVLNAKNDAEEAAIIAEAARRRDQGVHPDGRARHRHQARREHR